MLTSLRVYRQDGTNSFLELGFDDLPNKLWIKDVEGLGVKAVHGIEQGYFVPGGQYTNVFHEKRNVVLKLGYSSQTIDRTSLRRELFNYFVPGQEVKIEFYTTEMEPVYLMGHVETIEAPLFGQDPDIQISVVSDDRFFYALADTLPGISATSGSVSLPYAGDVPVGFTFDLVILTSPANFGFYRNNDTNFGINLLAVTESLRISTVEGARGIFLLSNPALSRLKFIQFNIEWDKLRPGDNSFTMRWANPGAVRVENFRWRNKYGGI